MTIEQKEAEYKDEKWVKQVRDKVEETEKDGEGQGATTISDCGKNTANLRWILHNEYTHTPKK